MVWLEDRLSGETLRVGVLLADSEAGRKKGAGISVEESRLGSEAVRICLSKVYTPSSRVWNKVKQMYQNISKVILKTSF